MKQFVVSDSFDPFFNLASETALFNDDEHRQTLYLWRNSDVVVIGRFQNPWKECNIEKMNADNVALMRRDTGGGAVFHDTENLCFTFTGFCDESDYRIKNTALVCRALFSLGFNAEPSGRNDILLNGAKISGAAFREKNGKYIHHGTVLIGTDLTRLANYLNPDPKKLISKGINSVRARVTNLQAFDGNVQVSDVMNALLCEAGCADGIESGDVQHKNIDCLATDENVRAEYNRLKSREWRFGKSPEFTHSVDGRFEQGGIEINLTVKNALIKDFNVYSDALDISFVSHTQNLLETFREKPYDCEKIAHTFRNAGFENIAELFFSHIDE
ncbi:MAG: lipoate--protein ligase [Spirochaetales bacterium]